MRPSRPTHFRLTPKLVQNKGATTFISSIPGGGGGGAGMGGAVFNQGGAVVIANSTITGNTAQGGAGFDRGIGGSGYGGGSST